MHLSGRPPAPDGVFTSTTMSLFGGAIPLPVQRLALRIRQGRGLTATAMGAAALALAVVLGGLHWMAARGLADAHTERDALSLDVQKLEQGLLARQRKKDFVGQLPAFAPTSAVTASIQRQALAHEVALNALSVRNEPATPKSLAYTGWALTLRGTYPAIKSVLAEVLDLVPSLRLQILKFTRTSAQEVEAQVALVQWLAPASVAPGTP